MLVNNIIWNDSLSTGGGEIYLGNVTNPVSGYLWNNLYGDAVISYSNIQDTVWQGTGNISADPMLFDSLMAPNDTMYCCLSPNSPCVDAGDPDTVYNDIPDPINSGFALFPAMGTVRNDMGVYGGHGKFGDIVVDIKREPTRQVVSSFSLSQNYPNPFNPSTTIEFELPKSSGVTLKVFNILGEEVATLVSDRLSTGSYSYEWDAGNLASGVYLYKLQAGDYIETSKMILMK